MRNAIAIAAATCSLALSSAYAASSAPTLTADQFKAAIIGQNLQWMSADSKYTVTALDVYNSDGSVTGTWKAGADSGDIAPASWVMQGNKVCVTQSPKNGGKTACHTWHKVNDVTYIEKNSNGSLHGTNTIMK